MKRSPPQMTRMILAAAATVLLLGACGSDDTGGVVSGTSTTAGEDEPTTTEAPSDEDATVRVEDHPELGEILVAANGHTLYLFEKDQGTTTACTGGCASNWPALTAPTPAGGEGIDASKLSTVNGQAPSHVVYNGHLLYFYAGDKAPGDVNGATIPSWFAVSPAGEKVVADNAAGASGDYPG